MQTTVDVNVRMSEELWRSLRRLAETERDSNGRASVSGIVNRLVTEAMAHRGQTIKVR